MASTAIIAIGIAIVLIGVTAILFDLSANGPGGPIRGRRLLGVCAAAAGAATCLGGLVTVFLGL